MRFNDDRDPIPPHHSGRARDGSERLPPVLTDRIVVGDAAPHQANWAIGDDAAAPKMPVGGSRRLATLADNPSRRADPTRLLIRLPPKGPAL
ncbi:hypothetical protein MHPYR_610034 [uncultured Mycobacterium sp.]|uniref:Uncharacterized protein n=1 Tax=uncultured Mycobacterium sp. TaxID=171292 RepID=A0A1Y5PJH7_9MYCO|nr:hypothetical protein MHPYR_610034 [uncultured Mycobacterium sp.]